tara:strand:+ start:2637 stop:2888 length:252 start_codon:yes stop_codon:yes gene_type:complete
MSVVRNIKYQEELKVLFEKLYRDEGMDEEQWQEKYRILNEGSDMELFGEAIDRFITMGKSQEDAISVLETMFREKMDYNDNAT